MFPLYEVGELLSWTREATLLNRNVTFAKRGENTLPFHGTCITLKLRVYVQTLRWPGKRNADKNKGDLDLHDYCGTQS